MLNIFVFKKSFFFCFIIHFDFKHVQGHDYDLKNVFQNYFKKVFQKYFKFLRNDFLKHFSVKKVSKQTGLPH